MQSPQNSSQWIPYYVPVRPITSQNPLCLKYSICWFPSSGPCLWQGPPRHIRPVAQPTSTNRPTSCQSSSLFSPNVPSLPECDQIAPKSCLEVLRASPAQPPANPALPINLPSSQKVAQSGLDSNIIDPLRIYYTSKTCPLGQALPNNQPCLGLRAATSPYSLSSILRDP